MILPSAIGAMVADLALDLQRTPPDAFRLDRFSGFASEGPGCSR